MLSRFARKPLLREIVSKNFVRYELTRKFSKFRQNCLVEHDESQHWPEVNDPFGMSFDKPLIFPSREVISESIYSASFFSITLGVGVILEFVVRMVRKYTYGEQITKVDHDKVCLAFSHKINNLEKDINTCLSQLDEMRLKISGMKEANALVMGQMEMNHEAQIKEMRLNITMMEERHKLNMGLLQIKYGTLLQTKDQEIFNLKKTKEGVKLPGKQILKKRRTSKKQLP